MGLRIMIPSALGLALASVAAFADTCPESCVFDICSTTPRNSATQSKPTILGPPAEGSASYDLVAGSVSARSYSGGDGSMHTSARGTDRFMLVGPSSPDPVSFTVSLRVVAAAGRDFDSGGGGSLREGNASPLNASVPYYDPTCGCGVSYVDSTLSLSLNHAVGAPFELTYIASAGASGPYKSASASGTLSFAGLPPGYGIVSCQGFVAGTPVPAHSRTWGGLKVMYR